MLPYFKMDNKDNEKKPKKKSLTKNMVKIYNFFKKTILHL